MAEKPAELNVSAYMTADPISVSADVKFFDAVTLMYKNGIGNLVVKKDNEAVGLISERQIRPSSLSSLRCRSSSRPRPLLLM